MPSSPTAKPSEAEKPPQPPMIRILSVSKYVGSAWLQQLSRPATAAPLLLTCLCVAVAYRKRSNWGAKKAAASEIEKPMPVLHRSLSIAQLHGGRRALERILDAQEARVDRSALEKAALELKSLLSEKQRDWNLLQSLAAKLEMSGKEDEAIEMLQKACRDELKQGNAHEAYELEMLLVEMLIYKGNYDEALKYNCLNDTTISDARCPLYKAIIYFMKGEKEEAESFYREFQDITSRFRWQDDITIASPLYGMIHEFEAFEKIVSRLKMEIQHAHSMKRASRHQALLASRNGKKN